MSYYKYHVFFCTHQRENGVACGTGNLAQALRDHAKQQVKTLKMAGAGKCRINNAGCMDRCNKGPVMAIYPEAVWYSYQNKADIDEIIEKHLQNGTIVERLQIK